MNENDTFEMNNDTNYNNDNNNDTITTL